MYNIIEKKHNSKINRKDAYKLSHKRKISSLITAFAISGTITGTIFAAYDPDKSGVTDHLDLKYLMSVFFGEKQASENDDVNGDGKLNIIDMIELKDQILSQNADTGKTEEKTYRAAAENVKLTGRSLDDGEAVWLVQSGAAAEFTVTASKAYVTLAGDDFIKSDEKYRPRYAVFVDGEQVADDLMSDTEKEITLFEGSTQRTANVKVIHLSEANNGAVGIKDIKTVSSALKPVEPVPQKELCIEFIGDSITCAYGVEASSNYDSFSTSTENFMKSYAYLTAQKLGADYSAVSYSGHGIISGYTSSGDKETESLVPDFYTYIGKLGNYKEPWDFTSRKNDVVVINLGTNDDTYISKDPETRLDEFTEGYADFLETVREKNPDAYIICTVGTMGCDEVFPAIESAVDIFKKSHDENIMCYLSAVQNPANGYGADWHPSEVTQQMSAYVLADKICTALGMPSDKIGLDAAADGIYDVNINKDAGANASTYLGYDKSFWVNMVGGGTEKTDIQAYISGIDLTEGTYRLQFDCTSGKDIEMPVSVQQNYGDHKKYYEDTVSVGQNKIHYDETFVLSKADDNCMIAFDIGGADYFNVTFSNVSLVKIC